MSCPVQTIQSGFLMNKIILGERKTIIHIQNNGEDYKEEQDAGNGRDGFVAP